MYYNAYNDNDYGILFNDQFISSIPFNYFTCASAQTCLFNYTIPANSSFASAVFGQQSVPRMYNVPGNVNGYYYLVLLADATGKFQEQNEQNNVFYTTSQFAKFFSTGYSQKKSCSDNSLSDFKNPFAPGPENLKKNIFNSVVNMNPNAYSP